MLLIPTDFLVRMEIYVHQTGLILKCHFILLRMLKACFDMLFMDIMMDPIMVGPLYESSLQRKPLKNLGTLFPHELRKNLIFIHNHSGNFYRNASEYILSRLE